MIINKFTGFNIKFIFLNTSKGFFYFFSFINLISKSDISLSSTILLYVFYNELFIIVFISLTSPIKADLNDKLIDQLESGGKLIFIRHAYAPGNGDPNNFNLNDCSTQRNLSEEGRKQAQYIGEFFERNRIW